MHKFRYWIRFLLIFWLLALAACAAPGSGQQTAPPSQAVETAQTGAEQAVETLVSTMTMPTATLTAAPTDTPAPGLAVAYSPAGDASVEAALPAWQEAAANQGLKWEQQPSLNLADLPSGVRLALVFPGGLAAGTDLSQLAASAPQVQFVAFNLPDVQPGPNLTVVGPLRYDQQSFLAGSIAAMLTPDWRVGVISISDTAAGQAARTGFLNGAAYFCGLCNPYYGPIVDYPLYVEIPAASDSAQWQAAAQQLIDQAVETVYLAPGVTDAGLLTLLETSQVNVISAGLPVGGPGKNHLVSILPDYTSALDLLPQILGGQAGGQAALNLAMGAIGNSFSPGRQRLAAQILADLQDGYIDPEVNPAP